MPFTLRFGQKLLFVCLLCSILLPKGLSQTRGGECQISGRVVDSISKSPIEYAAISIFFNGKTDVAGGIITDDKGRFIIDNLEQGFYKLKIDYIGYKTRSINEINIKKGDNKLGDLPIVDNSKTMKEVTVTGTKSFIENKIDKFVFNVGSDITSSGGTATDVLKKVPQVSVDVDGNVELLGNSNIKVLLNGKPSPQFDNNLADALRVIPASQIEKIEVITSPGAQYDAEGTGGIINIILKESKTQGINGNVNLSAGSRLESGSVYLHAQKNKVQLNLSLSSNETIPSTTLTSLTRKSTSNDSLTTLLQDGRGTSGWYVYRGQFGLDWDATKNDHFSTSIGYFHHANNSFGPINQQQIISVPTGIDTQALIRNSTNSGGFGGVDFTLSYKKNFKKDGEELTLRMNPGNYVSTTNFSQNQSINDVLASGAKGQNRLTEYENYLTADYAYPFSKDVTLNTGAKGVFTRVNSYSDHSALETVTGEYVTDPSFNNNFDYSRDIYSAYASLSFPLHKDYSFKLGLRDEYTLFHKVHSTDSTIPSYNTACPSAVISRKLSKDQTLKISYAYRLQRPGWWNMNPYIDATDPTNLQQGNPALIPEKVHNMDISYFHSFEKGSSILVMLYYRYSLDDEQSYVDTPRTRIIGDSVYKNAVITTNVNAGTQQVTGLNISGTIKGFDEKLEIRGNLIVFNKYIVSSIVAGATSNSLNYRTNLNISYKFTNTLVAECYGNFRSQSTEIQGKFPSFSSYSIAIRKLFWDKNGSLAFTTTNPFTPYVDQATNITGTNFTMSGNQKILYQSFGLSFTCKFGKMEFKDTDQGGGDMGGGEERN